MNIFRAVDRWHYVSVCLVLVCATWAVVEFALAQHFPVTALVALLLSVLALLFAIVATALVEEDWRKSTRKNDEK